MESALKLDQPLRLDRLGLMLDIIRAEFADYKLTKASVLILKLGACTDTGCDAGELLGHDIGHSRAIRDGRPRNVSARQTLFPWMGTRST